MKKQASSRLLLIAVAAVTQLALTAPICAADDSIKPIQNPDAILPTPDYTGDFANRSTLTGDWGGTRQELANKGVTMDANLTQVTQGVVSGGIDTGWEYMGRGQTTLNLDTAKMGLWPGGLFTLMGEGNFGNPITNKSGYILNSNVNDLFPEEDNGYMIPQLSFTQFLSKEFGIAFGKVATVTSTSGDMNSFAHGVGSEQFLNTSFNFNPIIAVAIPYSTLGAMAIIVPNKDLIISAGVVDPHGVPDEAGVGELFDDGATFALEGRYTTNFCEMTGHQLLGWAYSTSDYTDLDQRAVNLIIPELPISEADDSWAVYWNADQYVYQPNPSVDKGVGVFARFGLSDGQANPIHDFLSFGVGGKGIIPDRENDSLGLGYFYFWAANQELLTNLGFDDAQGVEAYYSIALTPALHLSPDLQWIDPSQSRVDSSWIANLRLYSVF